MLKQLFCAATAITLSALALTGSTGCAGADVTQSTLRAGLLPKPDMIVVTDFAVTPSEVKLDRGMMATAMRDAENRPPAAAEAEVGHLVSEKMAQALVDELRKNGIAAARARDNPRPTDTTVVLSGQFVTIDQGDQSARVWIGFGLGGSKIRTRVQLEQGGRLVAEGQTETYSNLKPGMLVSLGAGAAAESGAAIAAGAAGTGLSETVLATVDADAQRTAKEVAARVRRAYVERGWLPG